MFAGWNDKKNNSPGGALATSIKRNTVAFGRFDGHPVVFKRRNHFGRLIAPFANLFFRCVHANISMIGLAEWQRREVTVFRRLNAPYAAWPAGRDAICEDRIPGESLWEHLQRGTLTRQMVEAAARELRFAHRIWSEVEGGLWSHGDAAMCNIVYDSVTDRAYLIDFELMHDRTLPARARQADDVCVFLLDLVSYIDEEKWIPFALAYLRAYGHPAMVSEIRSRLAAPPGLPQLWWKIRTNFVDADMINRRLDELQAVLDRAALGRPRRRRMAGGSREIAPLPPARL